LIFDYNTVLRSYKTTGIIIKRTNYSEADRILTIFTKHHGKIKVIAKGVRKITSRRGGNVELFNLAEITLHEGKNFDLLTEANVLESFLFIRQDLHKIGWSYYLCELIDGLCPEKQENSRIFDLLLSVLLDFNKDSVKHYELEQKINYFETSLLKELGFWPKDKELPISQIESFLENLLERKLKSKNFLKKLN